MSAVKLSPRVMRGIFGILLLLLLLVFVDRNELISTLSKISLFYILYLFLIAVLMIWISSVKWRMFLRSQGQYADVFFLMRLYTIGYFVNTFTPSFIGGDIVRSLHLGEHITSKKDAFIATFLERFTGLLAMALLGLIFVLYGSNATAGVEVAVLIVGFSSILLATIVFCPPLTRIALQVGRYFLRRAPRVTMIVKLEGLSDRMLEAAQTAQAQPLLVMKAMGLSFVYHILTIINTQAAAYAIGWKSVDLSGLFVVVPLVLLVGMAPVTPSGIGIQEGAFFYFLQRIGGSKTESLGVGIVLRAKVIVIAFVGWLLWITMRKPASVEARHAS